MQMKVFVDVDMIEHESRVQEHMELRSDLRLKLPPDAPQRKQAYAFEKHFLVHAAIDVCDPGHKLLRQHCATIDQHEMQPDTQTRQPLCADHGVCKSRRADHQACRGQYTCDACPFDSLVDRFVAPKIIGGND